MSDFTTVRVGQLVETVFSGTDNIPHEVGTDLRRGTIADLATYISGIIGSTSGVSFLPISVVDGQTLPNTTTNEWFLAGAGTYLQTGGYPNIVCTEKLNVIISNGTSWSLGFGIPIVVDPPTAMISQTVNLGVTNYSPSEDAVYKKITTLLETKQDVLSLGDEFYIDLNDIFRLNISTYRQVEIATQNNQAFTLDFEPTFIISVIKEGIYLLQNQYIYTTPNQLQVLANVIGETIEITYEKFINEPTVL